MADDGDVIRPRFGTKGAKEAREQIELNALSLKLAKEMGEDERERLLSDAEFLAHNLVYLRQTRDRMELTSEYLRKRGVRVPKLAVEEEIERLKDLSLAQICALVRSKTWTQWESRLALYCALEVEYEMRIDGIAMLFPQD